MCEFWRNFMKRLGIQLCPTTANHPEADGQTERTNRTLLQYLRIYVSRAPTKWLDYLPCAEYVYNTSVHSSTGCTPTSLVYTEQPLRDPQLEIAVGSQQSPAAVEGFMQQLTDARECMQKAQQQQAKHYNKKRQALKFNPGDLVLVAREGLRGAAEGTVPKKFAQKWLGPFTIKSKINALAYHVDLPAAWKNHRVINIGFLKQFKNTAEFTRTLKNPVRQTAAPQQEIGIIEVRQVRKTSGRNKGKREFQVRWAGEKELQWIDEGKLKESIGEIEFAKITASLQNDEDGVEAAGDGARTTENV